MRLNIKKTALVTALGATLATASIAQADDYFDEGRIDYARVIHVTPITKTVEVSNPVERCWDKQVAYNTPRYNSHSGYVHRNEAYGAIIGAVVGNQVAKKSSNRKAATVAGAVIGTMIGNDMKKKKQGYYNNHVSYKTVKHCEVQQNVSYEETVVAYKVRYKYRGKEYTTRMNHHPGDRIKVRVSVTPVDY